MKTIEDVARFLGVSPKNKIKTLAYMAEEKTPKPASQTPCRRGPHARRSSTQRSEVCCRASAGSKRVPCRRMRSSNYFDSPAGFLGPIGIEWAADMKDGNRPVLLVDKALEGRKNLIAGANKEDYHLKNLTPGHNFQPTAYADLRTVTAGEACPELRLAASHRHCSRNRPHLQTGLQIFRIHGRERLDRNGKEVLPIMGCYGIGIERILTAAIEQNNDENGFWLPPSIAPFEIVVVPLTLKMRLC